VHRPVGGGGQGVRLLRTGRSPTQVRGGSLERQNPIVRIHLLGPMRALTFLGEDVLPRGKKARALLGMLCLAGGKPTPRARLSGLLWDRVPESQARTNFRQALREMSVSMGVYAKEIIHGDREAVRIDADLCWIDALAVLEPKPSSLNSWRSDLSALCSGELLDDLAGASASFDQWLLAERSRFSSRLKALLEEELKTADGLQIDAGQRAAVAQRLINYDATHERACRVLMRALADLGDRAQAIREYQRCRRALKEALDVEPSQATQALYADIRSQPVRREAAQLSRKPTEFGNTALDAHESVSARNRLRVSVLLFQELSPAVDRSLAFSLSQEIAAALARFRWFDVIAPGITAEARNWIGSSKGMSVHKEVDYVVDGTLRKSRDGLLISVRLLDLGQEAQPVWSDRFELAEDQLHLLDELVTARIVGRIDPVILFIEGRPRRRERYGATGLLLRAIPLMYSMQQEKYQEAGKLINQAMDTDPDNAMAAAWGAHWQVFHVGQGWARNIEDALATAEKHALRAIRLDPDNAEALGIYAHVCAFLDKDYDSALYYFDRSLRLNPSLGFVWALSAVTHCYIGMPDAALTRMERYRDVAPFDPYYSFFDGVRALAYLLKGEYGQAVAVGRRMVRTHPDFVNAYKTVIAALGHLGRRAEAQSYVRRLLLLEPGFTTVEFEKLYPLKRSVDRKLYVKGLQLAGVPTSDLQRPPH